MVSILLTLLLQTPVAGAQTSDVPTSLDRIREGLDKPGRFDLPATRPWRRPLFKVEVQQRPFVFKDMWVETSPTPPWVRPSAPPFHYEFLSMVTPDEFRAATLHPCCDVLPALTGVRDFVAERIRAAKERSAKREVEEAMRAAGIRR